MKELTILCIALNVFAAWWDLGRAMSPSLELKRRRSHAVWFVIDITAFAINLWLLSTFK